MGDYATWADAAAQSTGYDSEAIVQRVLAATLAVREGRAAFERDGIMFAAPEPEPALLDAFRRIVSDTVERPIRVLDFGGALGTTFWRHRAELRTLGSWQWDVVEQPAFAAVGRARVGGEELRFFDCVADAEQAGTHHVLLASTVLQYLPDPHATVANWISRGFPWILLNNLPLHAGGRDQLKVQRVPPQIYPASYPVWFFNRDKLLASFACAYDVVHEFPAEAVWPIGFRSYPSTGVLFRRRTHP